MKVNKSQAMMFILKTLYLEKRISRTNMMQELEINALTFRRYIQEIRSYLVNFNEPYELIYNKFEDVYFLRKI